MCNPYESGPASAHPRQVNQGYIVFIMPSELSITGQYYHAGSHRQRRDGGADQQRHATAVHRTIVDVSAHVVIAEKVRRRG